MINIFIFNYFTLHVFIWYCFSFHSIVLLCCCEINILFLNKKIKLKTLAVFNNLHSFYIYYVNFSVDILSADISIDFHMFWAAQWRLRPISACFEAQWWSQSISFAALLNGGAEISIYFCQPPHSGNGFAYIPFEMLVCFSINHFISVINILETYRFKYFLN